MVAKEEPAGARVEPAEGATRAEKDQSPHPGGRPRPYGAAPLSSKVLALVIVVGLVAPLVFLGWVAYDKSRDKNTVGDAFGALLFLVVIGALLWTRIKFGLRVRSMTTEQIRGELRPQSAETKRKLHLIRRSPLAMAGLLIVGFMVSMSILAPALYSLGLIDHWDPSATESPVAQNYFQLLPPSIESPQKYDLFLTRAYLPGPPDGPESGFGAYIVGKASVSVTGRYASLKWTTPVTVNVSDSKTEVDRVELSAPELEVQAGGSLRIEASAFDAQGRRLAANFDWSLEGAGAGVHPRHGSETTLHTSVGALGSKVKVIATARLFDGQPKTASIEVDVKQMPDWKLEEVVVWPEATVGEISTMQQGKLVLKPKTVEAVGYAANGSRIPGKLLQVAWDIVPGSHNASLLPDPNLPPDQANVTNTRFAAAGVPVDVRATVSLGPDSRSNTSRILFAPRLDIDRVEVSPPSLGIVRGEYVEMRARAFDEVPQTSGRFYEIADAELRWSFGWEGGGRPGATDWAATGPEVSHRIVLENPGPGGYLAQIESTGDPGPFFFDGTILNEGWDAGNLSYVDRTETAMLCRPNDKSPCETFKAANVLGGGDPLGKNEIRSFEFTASAEVKSLRLRLFGPEPTLFGRDKIGRDYLSVLVWGSQISLRISFIVVSSAVLIGVVLGGLAGYLGGKVDELVMRITDVFLAIPGLILAMGVAAVLTRSLDNIMYALVVVSWPGYTRLIRAQALSVRESLYVEAARAVGVPEGRIIMRHVIPNCLSPVLVAATLDIGGIVLTAAALSFIGFGALPPTPEWGLLINEGIAKVGTAWWLVTLPGVMIFIFVLGFNLFGDGLRDILDPKLRQ